MRSAAVILQEIKEQGGTIYAEGERLRVRAPRPLPEPLMEQARAVKQDLIKMLSEMDRDAAAWRARFDELLAIRGRNSLLSRTKAKALAYGDCIIKWLIQHPERSDPDRCAWCDVPDQPGWSVVPFGTEAQGHVWLHPFCWAPWFERRKKEAAAALLVIGIAPKTSTE